MSRPVFLVLARVPASLFFDVFGPSRCNAHARWWGGRAILGTVLNFCVALFVTAMAFLTLDPYTLAATDRVDTPGRLIVVACA